MTLRLTWFLLAALGRVLAPRAVADAYWGGRPNERPLREEPNHYHDKHSAHDRQFGTAKNPAEECEQQLRLHKERNGHHPRRSGGPGEAKGAELRESKEAFVHAGQQKGQHRRRKDGSKKLIIRASCKVTN